MKVTFRKTNDKTRVKALHDLIFVGDHHPHIVPSTAMWIGETEDETPVAFCMARKLRWENAVFLERAGVLPLASGMGLQRRMIRLRERWARSIGAGGCITYTTLKNYSSMVNLERCGYRYYYPSRWWAGENTHYFRKDFDA